MDLKVIPISAIIKKMHIDKGSWGVDPAEKEPN